jgi:hypothetical protein
MFYLKQVQGDQLKHLQWFVMGALWDHNQRMGDSMFGSEIEFRNYLQDTINKIVRYLKGEQAPDASFSDFQCALAIEARLLFNPTPTGFVTNGDVEFTTEGQLPPNFANGLERSEAQARYWMDECKMRVLPVYVGKAIN